MHKIKNLNYFRTTYRTCVIVEKCAGTASVATCSEKVPYSGASGDAAEGRRTGEDTVFRIFPMTHQSLPFVESQFLELYADDEQAIYEWT